VLLHYFDRFLAEYEERFEKEYGFLRPIIKEVVERYVDCRMDYLEFIARVTSHIPDKGQVTIRYFGLYPNAHRGKVRKAEEEQPHLLIIQEACPRIPCRGWAEIRRKVYEIDPLLCPQCGGTMKVIAFLTDFSVVDRIINHLKLTFVADKPHPPQVAFQELLMAAEASAEYFS
jgi:hypothetical protein